MAKKELQQGPKAEYHRQYSARRWRDDPEWRERKKAIQRAWSARNRKSRREYAKKWRSSSDTHVARMLVAAKSRARKFQIDFSIDEDDIVIPATCPLLGIPLTLHSPRGQSYREVASLDRIDNSKGYIKGNVQVISWKANSMKSNATAEELLYFARALLRQYG